MYGPKKFNEVHWPHDVHAAAVCLGVFLMPELTVQFSCGYFVIDTLVNLCDMNPVFFIHGAVMWYLTAKCQEEAVKPTRMYLALVVEFSTPFLHWWQRKEDDKTRFLLLYITFTLFRVIGAPYWWFWTVAPHHDIEPALSAAIGVLLSLQIVWFFFLGHTGWKLFTGDKKQHIL